MEGGTDAVGCRAHVDLTFGRGSRSLLQPPSAFRLRIKDRQEKGARRSLKKKVRCYQKKIRKRKRKRKRCGGSSIRFNPVATRRSVSSTRHAHAACVAGDPTSLHRQRRPSSKGSPSDQPLGPPMNGSDQGTMMPALTVGEANLKACKPRALMWVWAVVLPSFCFAISLGTAYAIYAEPHSTIDSFWRLLPIILCGVHMALVSGIPMYMDLFLPHAPAAIREALFEVGWYYVCVPLMITSILIVCSGLTWMVVIMVCWLLVVIFVTVAFWVYLVRTYKK